MKCPRCQIEVSFLKLNYEGIEIDRCSQCRGVWLDAGELRHVIETKEAIFSEELTATTLREAFGGVPVEEVVSVERCPVCDAEMLPVNYRYDSGVIIDGCPRDHGVWLDAGELAQTQIHGEHWENETQKNRKAWENKASESLSAHAASASQKRKESMSFLSYYLDKMIRNLFNIS